MRIERNDLIFQPSEGVQCHASHLTPLADGGVLAVWFQGSREGADDVCIWGARSPISLLISKDGGAHWEHLTHLVTMPGEYSYPAVLWQDGCLLITHTWQRKSIQFWKIRL